MAFSLKTFVLLIVLNSCICQQITDKRANAKTKQILDYIVGLPKKGRVIFNCFYL
jgi:hypothetical protein